MRNYILAEPYLLHQRDLKSILDNEIRNRLGIAPDVT